MSYYISYEMIVQIFVFFFILFIYQKTQSTFVGFPCTIISSIFIVVIFFAFSKYVIYDIFLCGLLVMILLTFILQLIGFKKIVNILCFSSFVTTLIFFSYFFVRLLNRKNTPINDYTSVINYLIFTDYTTSLFVASILLGVIVYLFKLKFCLPETKISFYIVFFSCAILVLELLFFKQIKIISLKNLTIIIVFIFIGLIFLSSNIIIQYLYNDYHQLTMMSQNNFISKITDSYINGIQKEQEKVYKIKHDIKNNLIILQHLINNEKLEDANKILQEISQNLEYKKSDIYTGNIFIDAYLTNIINTSKIDIQMKCSDLKEMHYKPDVLSIIINLVDNAVENASSRVNLYIKYEDKNHIMIKVSNDCENDPTKLLKKSKKKGDHGYGLRIVKDIVNKYKGTYLTSYENHIFTTYVIINIEDENEK